MNMKVVIAVLAGAGILGAAMILSSRNASNPDRAGYEDTLAVQNPNLDDDRDLVDPGDREPELPTEKIPANNPPPRRQTPAPSRPAPTPAPTRSVTIPAGTMIRATLQNSLASHESHAGDTFTMRVSEPVIVNGYTAIPAGATINGVVTSVKESGKIKGRGDITLGYRSVTDVNGRTHTINAENFYGRAEAVTDRDAAVIAGGAGTGAIIGGIVGGKKGALIGGVIGGAAGTGTVLATKGPEVKLAPGTEFGINLQSSLEVPAGSRS
jgi:hypothetical protein